MRTALAAFLLAAPVAALALTAQAQSRLPPGVFDVIPPESRVAGRPGDMYVVQRQCRVGPTAWARRRIVDVAVQEWAVFGFQTVDARPVETRRLPDGVVPDALNPERPSPRLARHMLRFGSWEDERRLSPIIAGYWSATPDGEDVIRRQNHQWKAADGEVTWVEPWSAAFISWVMCEAGLGDPVQFRRDIAHRVYIDQAIRARDGEGQGAAYVAWDPGEAEIAPGDLICNGRGGVTYRSLADRRADMGRAVGTHCDVVVRVADDRINVIGGNVINGVTLTILPMTRDVGAAFARPLSVEDMDGARTLFAHLKLQSDPVEPEAMDNSPTIRALSGP